jgi:hypothetical protein
VVVSELRALGGLVLEQALQDSGARPQASLVGWAGRLAADEVNREAQANPDRPTHAVPLAA